MTRLTISVPDHLAQWLDRLAARQERSRSAVVVELVEQELRRRLDQEMAEGYQLLAEDNRLAAEEFRSAQAEVISDDRPR